jgi:hypothetical protein
VVVVAMSATVMGALFVLSVGELVYTP